MPLVSCPPPVACRRSWLAAVCGIVLAGCATKDQLASHLEQSLRQEHLPKVYACWERTFESAGFRGEYVATADFVVASDTGQLSDVVVRDVRPSGGFELSADAAESERFRGCLEKALSESSITGSGWTPDHSLAVRGFRLAFIGAPAADRPGADKTSANLLIGPRANRCLGLYAYEPPREAGVLLTELADAQAAAGRVAASERDGRARALQKVYDLALELRARLSIDALQKGLKEANRARTRQAAQQAQQTAREVGDQIGCKVPELEP